MSLDNILNKIRTEGQAEAAKITANAQASADAILAEAKAQTEQRRQEILAQAKREADEDEQRQLTVAGLEARKDLLMARQEVIEQAFAQALADLRKMPSADYRQLLKGMLMDAVQTGDEEIVVDQIDRALFTDAFLAEINEALVAAGKQGHLRLGAGTRHTDGGFILTTGEVDINATFATRLKELREDLEPEVAKVLMK